MIIQNYCLMIIPRKRLNSSLKPINGTLIGTNIPGQSGAESNGKKGVLNISLTPIASLFKEYFWRQFV